jgi:hypothetical protein
MPRGGSWDPRIRSGSKKKQTLGKPPPRLSKNKEVPEVSKKTGNRMMFLRVAMALVLHGALVSAIYPSDHWTFSTQLTESNFDSTIKENIDSGKTMFIRFIASEG